MHLDFGLARSCAVQDEHDFGLADVEVDDEASSRHGHVDVRGSRLDVADDVLGVRGRELDGEGSVVDVGRVRGVLGVVVLLLGDGVAVYVVDKDRDE
eukprot:12105764-Heterocapsa_arctica.AAC.1